MSVEPDCGSPGKRLLKPTRQAAARLGTSPDHRPAHLSNPPDLSRAQYPSSQEAMSAKSSWLVRLAAHDGPRPNSGAHQCPGLQSRDVLRKTCRTKALALFHVEFTLLTRRTIIRTLRL